MSDLTLAGRPATCSRLQFDEPGGKEVSVEGQRIAYPKAFHEDEARGVHERILALVALAEKTQGLVLLLLRQWKYPNTGRSFYVVEESDRRSVSGAPPKIGPGFAADMVGGHDATVCVGTQDS